MTLDPTFFVNMGESGAGERSGPRRLREGEREKENKRPRDTEENEHRRKRGERTQQPRQGSGD